MQDLSHKGKRKSGCISPDLQDVNFSFENEEQNKSAMEIEIHKKQAAEGVDSNKENAKEDEDNEIAEGKTEETGKNNKTGNLFLK